MFALIVSSWACAYLGRAKGSTRRIFDAAGVISIIFVGELTLPRYDVRLCRKRQGFFALFVQCSQEVISAQNDKVSANIERKLLIETGYYGRI